MPPSRKNASAAAAPTTPVDTHSTILDAIRILLDASAKTTSDPAGARASVGAALRLLVPIVAPESQGPDDGGGTRLPGR
ncbi:hypothetical protein [Paludibaculum fermentans]|uniref:Uncharacterized protein n=1 Tax=Paludibaculum fermentans TaxID=1473598 RepID=A0A7S7SMQ7_PALFE|nr:hypothetical protein [Paludibaculum fermentans]QOY89290.1 hypothetical protein IRI77_04855 [Paludibaculum fermentans]